MHRHKTTSWYAFLFSYFFSKIKYLVKIFNVMTIKKIIKEILNIQITCLDTSICYSIKIIQQCL